MWILNTQSKSHNLHASQSKPPVPFSVSSGFFSKSNTKPSDFPSRISFFLVKFQDFDSEDYPSSMLLESLNGSLPYTWAIYNCHSAYEQLQLR